MWCAVGAAADGYRGSDGIYATRTILQRGTGTGPTVHCTCTSVLPINVGEVWCPPTMVLLRY